MAENTALQIIKAEYTASAIRQDQYPEGDLREIAFLGRSNVGKSSLINSLCNRRGLARVSGEPGKTQTVNFFTVTLRERVGEEGVRYPLFFVDLPGYGFAKTGVANRRLWSTFIGEYIEKSPRLSLLCLLVDLRHPGLDIDSQAYAWMKSHGVPLQIVGTKADKLKSGERKRNLAKLDSLFPGTYPAVAYSSLKNDGRDTLLQRFRNIVAHDE
jgi:GTP-binding protein